MLYWLFLSEKAEPRVHLCPQASGLKNFISLLVLEKISKFLFC